MEFKYPLVLLLAFVTLPWYDAELYTALYSVFMISGFATFWTLQEPNSRQRFG